MFEVMVMMHAVLGLLVLLAGIWVFVEALNVSQSNVARIRLASLIVAVAMWVTFAVAGYWYVAYYAADKALILKGPWPFAHNFFMETKEHVVLMLLLLTTFLPIASQNDLVGNKGARSLFLCVAGLIVLIGVAVEGSGGIISMGAKLGAALR
ncbi:MAG: hypothetical protein ABSE08_19625 [Syntrophobacteraceae bacterium]|jgi:hypothetical protein